jgi:hypothetical protein
MMALTMMALTEIAAPMAITGMRIARAGTPDPIAELIPMGLNTPIPLDTPTPITTPKFHAEDKEIRR